MAEEITIRHARPADYDAVAALWLAGWLSTGLSGGDDPTVAELRARIEDELGSDWPLTVATVGGEVVGMLALRPARLDQLFLMPDWQGRGIGKALFAEAERQLSNGFTLWANIANEKARGFYERQGMVLTQIGPPPDKPEQIVAHYQWPA